MAYEMKAWKIRWKGTSKGLRDGERKEDEKE